MQLYDVIAGNYESLFPLETEKLDFIQRLCAPPARIFDIGCATGELALALARAGYRVHAIDLNAKMIDRAQKATARLVPAERDFAPDAVCPPHTAIPEFKTADMRFINDCGVYDAALCFGNTLVHLATEREVYDFFVSVYKSLINGGFFVFQILNYDKILSEHKAEFRTIEAAGIVFKRSYEFLSDGKIGFTIELTDTHNGITHFDSAVLLPLRQKTLFGFLDKALFKNIHAFADYKGTKSDLTEFATVYAAQK